jgi:hypothetical protein
MQDAADARYVPTGHIVFLRQATLMAVGFEKYFGALAALESVDFEVEEGEIFGDDRSKRSWEVYTFESYFWIEETVRGRDRILQ